MKGKGKHTKSDMGSVKSGSSRKKQQRVGAGSGGGDVEDDLSEHLSSMSVGDGAGAGFGAGSLDLGRQEEIRNDRFSFKDTDGTVPPAKKQRTE